MPRAVYGFVNFKAAQDPLGEITCSALCVTGDEADCGSISGDVGTQEELARWMGEHTRDTGHSRFRRTFTDYAVVQRQGPAHSPVASAP